MTITTKEVRARVRNQLLYTASCSSAQQILCFLIHLHAMKVTNFLNANQDLWETNLKISKH